MMKFDHLSIPVTNLEQSRHWYVATLGLTVEFEAPDRKTVALNDSDGFALFLQELPDARPPVGCAFWFRVEDVDETYRTWRDRGIAFKHRPQKNFWGYGSELSDPDGYLVRLWDERTMKEKS